MATVRAKKPKNRRQRGLWQQSIEDRFELFDAANAWVWNEIIRQAEETLRAGDKRCSMKRIWENIRTQVGHGASLRAGRLNNSFTSRYSLKLKAQRPDLAVLFETREIKAA